MEEPRRAVGEVLDLGEDRGGGVPEGLPPLLVVLGDEVVDVADPVRDGDDDLLVALVDARDAEHAGGVLLLLVQDLLGELHGGVDLEGEGPDRLRTLVHGDVLEELGLVVEDDLGGFKDPEDGLADVCHFKIFFPCYSYYSYCVVTILTLFLYVCV